MLGKVFEDSSEQMSEFPDDSVALLVTSPPYHVGKDYDGYGNFHGYLEMIGKRSARRTEFWNRQACRDQPRQPGAKAARTAQRNGDLHRHGVGFFCRGKS